MSYDPGAHGDRPQQPVGQGWGGGQQYPGGYGQQPPTPGWGGQQPPAGMPTPMAPSERSGFSALFDFSFVSFATPSLIRLLYIVGTVLIGLYYVGFVIFSFTTSAAAGLITLVFGAVVALFMMALLRVSLEFYFAVVRMSEDIHNNRR
jgi:Domain of unknown function (DUF4282)